MIRSWGSAGSVHNQDFVKGEGPKPQVIKFYKYIKIWRSGEQIRAAQTYHRRAWGIRAPAIQRLLE